MCCKQWLVVAFGRTVEVAHSILALSLNLVLVQLGGSGGAWLVLLY